MFFESEFMCPNCGATKGFYVNEATETERVSTYSSDYKPAHNWAINGDKVRITIKCDKCWKEYHQNYNFTGNPIGECKWAD